MARRSKHSIKQPDRVRLPVATDHTHPVQNRTQVLLAIAVLGVLLTALQLFNIINSRGAERTRELAIINQRLAQQAEQSRVNACTFVAAFPPGDPFVDKIRTAAKCGPYVPPKKTGTATQPSSTKKASNQSKTIAVSAAAPNAVRSSGSSSVRSTAPKPPAPKPTQSPSPTTAPPLLVVPRCILVVCIK